MSSHSFLFKKTKTFRNGKMLLCTKDGWILQYNGINKATEIAKKFNGKAICIRGHLNKFYIEQA